MKQIVRNFCQGMYDAMLTNDFLRSHYTVDTLYEILYPAWISLWVKCITILLGLVACVLASYLFSISFSTLFWVGFVFALSWLTSDADIKKAIALFKAIAQHMSQ